VQGRYLFPVIVPLYGFFAHNLVVSLPRRLQAPVAVAVGLWFVYGDLPFFLRAATPAWQAAGP
jgi:hypothetical protein